jgi:hypothetical protein
LKRARRLLPVANAPLRDRDAVQWPALLMALVISHLVGDYLLQTDWQARNKPRGLASDGTSRAALLSHGLTYTLAFAPALLWLGRSRGARATLSALPLITIPHVLIDDGRLVKGYLRRVKRCPEPVDPGLTAMVDQSFHLVCLWAAATALTR